MLEVLTILGTSGVGGHKGFHLLKGSLKKFYPVLRGAQKVWFSHFVAPLPVINDQSPIL